MFQELAQQIQSHFQRIGIQMWSWRAQQVYETLSAFPKDRIDMALQRIFLADKALRDARPDDRLVMEDLALALTS